mmetsp:Transcript_29862/g.50170  ORF Transcript_29862/g.50170 Transcript_29862/m.50170 type:complete len:277 (+) Transcript_29862:2634-3464(+)
MTSSLDTVLSVDLLSIVHMIGPCTRSIEPLATSPPSDSTIPATYTGDVSRGLQASPFPGMMRTSTGNVTMIVVDGSAIAVSSSELSASVFVFFVAFSFFFASSMVRPSLAFTFFDFFGFLTLCTSTFCSSASSTACSSACSSESGRTPSAAMAVSSSFIIGTASFLDFFASSCIALAFGVSFILAFLFAAVSSLASFTFDSFFLTVFSFLVALGFSTSLVPLFVVGLSGKIASMLAFISFSSSAASSKVFPYQSVSSCWRSSYLSISQFTVLHSGP